MKIIKYAEIIMCWKREIKKKREKASYKFLKGFKKERKVPSLVKMMEW